jgi:hypothetical protein
MKVTIFLLSSLTRTVPALIQIYAHLLVDLSQLSQETYLTTAGLSSVGKV